MNKKAKWECKKEKTNWVVRDTMGRRCATSATRAGAVVRAIVEAARLGVAVQIVYVPCPESDVPDNAQGSPGGDG